MCDGGVKAQSSAGGHFFFVASSFFAARHLFIEIVPAGLVLAACSTRATAGKEASGGMDSR
eukprot:scaffold17843_cov131-Isochrysis_galbana.AAC.8